MKWTVCKYNKRWAILDVVSRCYVLFGTKREMEIRCKELNGGMKDENN